MKNLTDTEMATIAGGVTEGPNGEGCTGGIDAQFKIKILELVDLSPVGSGSDK